MTTLDDLTGLTPTYRAPRRFSYLLRRARRLINNAVAAAIARRQRQADFALLLHLGDRDLKDIGLPRSQIAYGFTDAARERQQGRDRIRNALARRIER